MVSSLQLVEVRLTPKKKGTSMPLTYKMGSANAKLATYEVRHKYAIVNICSESNQPRKTGVVTNVNENVELCVSGKVFSHLYVVEFPLWQFRISHFIRCLAEAASFYFTGTILIRHNIYTVIFKFNFIKSVG